MPSQPIAWKTGTSFGFKDAWAVGVTPKYAIGVWAGNADGEGRPGLVPAFTAAAPLLFDVLDALPHSGWFQEPFDDLMELEICMESGFIASTFCDVTQKELLPIKGTRSKQCPYHHQIFLNKEEAFRVNSDCYPLENMVQKNWFSLPTVVEYYYANSHPNYKSLPPFLEGCHAQEKQLMEFIYPKKNEEILLPRDLGKTSKEIIFKLAHQQRESTVHWYLDETYLGSTTNFHELIVETQLGNYRLTAVDDEGNRIQQNLSVQMAAEN